MFARIWLLLLGLCSFGVAYSQVAVAVDRPAKLFAKPTERSLVLTEISGRGSFRALEQSADKQWVFISDGLRYGWIRKAFLRVASESQAAGYSDPLMTKESVAAESADDDLPADDETGDTPSAKKASEDDDFEAAGSDASGQTYVVKTAGAFYEKPKKTSPRFGKVETGDQVELLETSSSGEWVRVRLQETGEEGWLPRGRVGRRVPKTELNALDHTSQKTHIGLLGMVEGKPWGFGGLAVLRQSFESLAIADIPVDIGVGIGYNMGSSEQYTVNSTAVTLAATYLDFRGFVHWEPRFSRSFGIPFELGGVIKYGVIKTNLTQLEFQAAKSRIRTTEFGGFLGVGITYLYNDSFKLELIPQLQVTSTADVVANAGLIYSF